MEPALILIFLLMLGVAIFASGRIIDIRSTAQSRDRVVKLFLGIVLFGSFVALSAWLLSAAWASGSIRCPARGCLTMYSRSSTPGAYWAAFLVISGAGTFCLAISIALVRSLALRLRA